MITMILTDQQKELVDASIASGEASDLDALVRLAIAESARVIPRRALPRARGRARDWRSEVGFTAARERVLRWEHRLEPGTGKALELRAGQILRISQVDGNQCADLNMFSLGDYREALHVGRTRTLHGIHPSEGDLLWSAPPRERAMAFILTDTARLNDTLFPRCSANMYESMFGFAEHTNCADIQAEAQREYGLTPDDVHDSFNLFMGTRVNPDGTCEVVRQQTGADDHIEILALMDLLVVPNVCGNDIFRTSNFALRPLRLEVWDGSEADLDAAPALQEYSTQRTPADFRQPVIRTERALQRDVSYVPEFARTPVVMHSVSVDLGPDDAAAFAALRRTDLYGDDDGAALRDVLLSWWLDSHA